MSSVLIKGMKMPSKCQYCGLLRYYPENGNVWCNASNKLMMERAWFEKIDIERPRWCPLIELPEKHGRLIDGDAVFDWYIKAFNSYPKIEPNEVRFSMNDIAGNLLNIPTIIEAEGE